MNMAARLLVRGSIVIALAMVGLASRANGQWLVRIEVGADRFWGGSEESAPEHRSFLPYRPTIFAGTLERRSAKVGVGVRFQYTGASLGLEGSDAVVAVKGVFNVYSFSPEVSYRIASLGSNNKLILRFGPLFEVWDIIDEEARTRLGAQAALAFTVPLGQKISAAVSGGIGLISSPFKEGELLPGYELQPLWRRRFAGGLEYRF